MLPLTDYNTLLMKLKSLGENKSAGPDGIPPVFVKKCAEYLIVSLLSIFNTPLQTGVFPVEWKRARVVPIRKSNSNNLVANYRLISILSTHAKILESLICLYRQRHFKQILSIH